MCERRFSTKTQQTGGGILDDKEIVRLFTERNESAIAAASEKYKSYLHKIAKSITNSYEDAEEIVNDVLLKAWELIPPHNPERLSSFLGKIARNEAISRQRAAAAGKRGNGELPLVLDEMSEIISDGSSVEQNHDYKELMREISAFLRKQPALKRDLFICRYWYCLSVHELSQKFGISENNAATTLCRTRGKLKDYLRKRGYDI